ncbi:MAG TPA: TolC family protein [Vicinamibacterales bacterium]|nr:TolC family protein [Vicinamibacterales bacterium]
MIRPSRAVRLVMFLALASWPEAPGLAQALTIRTPAAQSPSAAPLALSLEDAVTRGLQFNVAIIVQEQARHAVAGQRLEALSALLPHVSANVRQSSQLFSTAAFGLEGFAGFPSIIGPFANFDARVVFSAPVFDASARASLAAARSNVQAADAGYQSVRSTVVLAVANVYLQALSDSARVRSSQAQVETAESLVQLATDQNASGLVARIDVVRQQVELEAARAALIRAQNDLDKRKLQLAHAIGLPAAQTIELSDRPAFVPAPAISIEAAVADANQHRTDVQQARARVEAARADHQAAARSAWPTFRIDGDVGAIGLSAASADRTYSIAGAIHIPIYEGGKTQARNAITNAELKQREAELADLEAGVQFDVRTALLDVRAAEAAVEVARSGEALAREELTQAQDRFRAGVASTVEVTRAQDAVARASEQFIASVYAHYTAKAELASALGDVEHRYLQFIKGQVAR